MAKWGTKSWQTEETTLHKDGSSAVLNITLEKEGEKKNKKLLQHRYSYLVNHPNTNLAEQGLTLLSGWNMLLSLWYSDSTLNEFF